MRVPPASPNRKAPSDVVEHSGRQWHMDLAGVHATNFHVGGTSDTGADGSYVVYDIEIILPSETGTASSQAATATTAAHTVERLQKRWSQVEALHTELVEELPHLPWREIAFPRKWVKTMDEGDIEKRLRDMNGYFRALIQLLTKSRTLLRPTVAFGRFLAEPAFHRAGDEGRHTAQQLADIRAQSESDASDAAELKEAAKLAAEKIVKADIRKAQETGLGYEEFRSKYRPVGGDASLHKLWEQLRKEENSVAVDNGSTGGSGIRSVDDDWGALDLSRSAMSCEVMDPVDAPKRVVVSCYINDILKIDVVEETFTPLLSFTLDWTDDGAIEETKGSGSGWTLKVDEDELWRPFMDFENLVEKADSLDDTVGVFTQRGRPIVSQFRRHLNVLRPHKLDLREFPFDTLQLDVVLSFGWDSSELNIIPGVVEANDAVLSSAEYILTSLSATVSNRRYGYFERYDNSSAYPHMTISIQLARRPFYYIVRLVSTLCAITCMEYTSFLLEPSALSDRFGVSSAVVLAAIGIHYTAAENLPKVPYLTRLDKYMFLCYVLIFVSFVENIVAFKLHQGLPPGSRDTTNAALMACYASRWQVVCDADGLSKIENTLALVYVCCVGAATLWLNLPLWAFYRQVAKVGQKHLVSNEKAKME